MQRYIEYKALYRFVLNKIRKCVRVVLIDGEAITDELSDTYEVEQKGQREMLERSLTKDGERVDVLKKMVLRLYEDTAAGCSNEVNSNLLMERTQEKQAELETKVEQVIG